MISVLLAALWAGVKLLFAALALFYAGLVTVVYFTNGFRYGPPFNWHDPARAVMHLLIWAGVKLLGSILRGLNSIYEMFTDTSAELAMRVLGRRGAEVVTAISSRLQR